MIAYIQIQHQKKPKEINLKDNYYPGIFENISRILLWSLITDLFQSNSEPPLPTFKSTNQPKRKILIENQMPQHLSCLILVLQNVHSR